MHIDSIGLYDESSTLKYIQSIGDRVEKTHLIQYGCYDGRKNLWNQILNLKQLPPSHNFAAVHLSNLYVVACTNDDFILSTRNILLLKNEICAFGHCHLVVVELRLAIGSKQR